MEGWYALYGNTYIGQRTNLSVSKQPKLLKYINSLKQAREIEQESGTPMRRRIMSGSGFVDYS